MIDDARCPIVTATVGPLHALPAHWLAEAARLLPELSALHPGLPPPPPLDAPGGHSRFLEGLRQVLGAICQGPVPNVLFFDDMQWADADAQPPGPGRRAGTGAQPDRGRLRPAGQHRRPTAPRDRRVIDGTGESPTLDDPARGIALLNNLAHACAAAGNLAEATVLVERALTLNTEIGDCHREAALRNNLADLLHAAGREEAAMAQLKQAVVIFAEIGGLAGSPGPEIWKLIEW